MRSRLLCPEVIENRLTPQSTGADDSRRGNLEILNIRVVLQTDPLVDITLRHDFIGAGSVGITAHRA